MIFANADMLYFLALAPLLVIVFIFAERRRRAQVAAMVNEDRPGMAMGPSFERRLLFLIFLTLGVVFLVLAAARPQWGSKLEDIQSRGVDVIIAVDVSASMAAEDVSPSRIAKARRQVSRLLDRLEGDRVGLIAFAGSAYVYCPLTIDYAAARLFLNSLEPGVIADGGTDVAAAVNEAVETFERAPSTAQKAIVIFSDGEHHERDPLPAVMEAAAKNIQIFTVGVGRPDKSGARIPLNDDPDNPRYKMDQAGNLVISKLDEETLKAVAETGGGAYYLASDSGAELADIYRLLAEKEEAEFSSRRFQQREERFQIPLLIALASLAVAYSLGDRSFKKLRRTQGATS